VQDAWEDATDANPHWRAYPLSPGSVRGLRRYFSEVRKLVRAWRPEVLVSVSDVYHVILGDWLAGKYAISHVVDLYDNYESFGAARLPGVTGRYRKALRRAAGISCVSASLKDYLLGQVGTHSEPRVIHNAVDKDNFHPMDRDECRRRLGLPVEARIAGLGGSISEYRGVNAVFQAHRSLIEAGQEVHLALAGAVAGDAEIPESPYIHYLGQLDYDDMPYFYNALDVGIITNKDNPFSRYCFPQKFFELCACARPVVVASVGDVREFIAPCEQGLFTPGDGQQLAVALKKQLDSPCLASVSVPDWTEQGARLVTLLETLKPTRAG
jgi:glycosyltransferase involved in cell wall biosynthesis